MKIIETGLPGCVVFEPTVFEDHRGLFFESYNENSFSKIIGHDVKFVQDNQSFSKRGVLRGIHYQIGDFAQAKLVRVLQGEVLDIAVDLRKNSSTFSKYFSIKLSAKNKKQLFVPRGFGHAFVVLSDTAEFFYKCDNFYNKKSEGGIIYNDSKLNIDWVLPKSELILSEKDLELSTVSSCLL